MWVAHLILAGWFAATTVPGRQERARLLPAFQERVEVSAPADLHGLFDASGTSFSMGREELRALGMSVSRASSVAANAAGAFTGAERHHIDGMTSGILPAGEAAGGVSVRSDPFSVEYGGLDRLDVFVELAAPSRRWDARIALPELETGGGDPLSGGVNEQAHTSALVAGPIPRTPLTFFAHAARDHHRREAAVPSPAGMTNADRPVTSSRSHAYSLGSVWAQRGAVVRATFIGASTAIQNAGLGALAAPETGFSLMTASHRLQITWRAGERLRHRGGLAFQREAVSSEAAASSAVIISPALVVSGSSDLSARAMQAARWSVRHVVEPRDRRWLAGLELSRERRRETRLHNAFGTVRTSLDGSVSHMRAITRGAVDVAATTAALFAQRTHRVGAGGVRLGLRGEWCDGEGWFVSPRASLAAPLFGMVAGVSVGLVVEERPVELETERRWRQSEAAEWFIDDRSLRLVEDPGFRRRRDVIARLGVVRRAGPLFGVLQHTWTAGLRLAGATRVQLQDVLIDRIASDRRLRRQQMHLAAGANLTSISVSTHYEWVRSHDDTDGWLSFPQDQKAPREEWAPSSGSSRHHASMALSARPWRDLQIVVTGRASSGAAYSVLSGLDPEGLGTFSDRGGQERNDRRAPGAVSLDVYLSKGWRLDALRGFGLDTGVRLENALDTRRVGETGRVIGTPLFGVPLESAPGRAFGVWLSVARH